MLQSFNWQKQRSICKTISGRLRQNWTDTFVYNNAISTQLSWANKIILSIIQVHWMIEYDKRSALYNDYDDTNCKSCNIYTQFPTHLWLHARLIMEYDRCRSSPHWPPSSSFCLLCHMDLQPVTEHKWVETYVNHLHLVLTESTKYISM